MMKCIVIAGGGTGGHLFPGIAVVEEIRRRYNEMNCVFVGTRRGIEARLLPKMGEQLSFIDVSPILGRTIYQKSINIVKLPRSALQALRIIRKHRPLVVIGLGGYAAGPTLIAASFLGIPTVLLEQNMYVGLTNRLLSPIVQRAYLTYKETSVYFKENCALVCGNPIRRSFVEAATMAANDPAGLEARSKYVLVTAGSQGARVINQIIPRVFEQAGFARKNIRVLHQTGEDMVDEVKRSYRNLGIAADVKPFIEDMAKAYSYALLVVGRAGATTLAEMCAIGRPSVLIPYPHHKDDHQAKNALALVEAGAAIMIRENRLNSESVPLTIEDLLNDTKRRRRMADAARKLGRPDAAATIVDDLSYWLRHPHGRKRTNESANKTVNGSYSLYRSNGQELSMHRRPKVKRCQLRIQTVDITMDATG